MFISCARAAIAPYAPKSSKWEQPGETRPRRHLHWTHAAFADMPSDGGGAGEGVGELLEGAAARFPRVGDTGASVGVFFTALLKL